MLTERISEMIKKSLNSLSATDHSNLNLRILDQSLIKDFNSIPFSSMSNLSSEKNFTHMRQCFTKDVVPEHYDLHIKVSEKYFSGNVKIQAVATKKSNSFQINSKDLTLSKILVNNEEANFKIDDDVVTIDSSVEGSFTIEVEFEGAFGKGMRGFYASEQGQNDIIYSTHFEPSDARRAFPCFDQPDMKATFSISIDAPEGYTALSNQKLIEQEGNTFKFDKTPKMSTYIVAFVVGKLEFVEGNTADYKRSLGENKKIKTNGVPIRVYTSPAQKEWSAFSLEVACRCLAFFEQYFEIEYPLPKLDMVAIPSFAMGAMENWGLVTYRSTSLLFDPKTTAIRSKKNIAITVCHELAHMWFGNLVTMVWWNDLWLNEGFATWAATLAIAHSQKDTISWDAWTSFINDDIETGMEKDSLESTRKIEFEVNDPVEIDQVFDEIAYSKGASIIKMLENWIEPEVFRQGMVRYLKKHSWDNAVTMDLWESLNAQVQEVLAQEKEENTEVLNDSMKYEIKDLIGPWISREGFPYIVVTEEEDSIVLTQKRFTIGHAKQDNPWPIPVKIKWYPSEKLEKFVMDKEVMKIPKASELYKLNDSVSGFYRVLYSPEHFKKLLEGPIGTINKLNLFNDSFAFAKGLYSDYPFKYLYSLKEENNHEILESALGGISELKSIFYDDSEKLSFLKNKKLEIVNGRAANIDLTFPGDSVEKISTDSLLLSSALSEEDEKVIEKLQEIEADKVHAAFQRSFMIANVDKMFEKTLEVYLNDASPSKKSNALVALGQTKKQENLTILFENFEKILSQDSIIIFVSLSSNIKFRNTAVDFLIDNFDRIVKHISNENLVRRSMEYLFSHALADSHREKVLTFLAKIESVKEYESAIKKIRNSIDLSMKIREKYMVKSFEE